MKKIILLGLVVFLLFFGYKLLPKLNLTDQVSDDNVPQSVESPIFDCPQNKDFFLEVNALFFENIDYDTWCQECVEQNGRPQFGYVSSPFCNVKTSDNGKKCTDSSQCEGYCLADEEGDNFGFCTEYEQLSDGCGWFEVIDGEVAERCIN